MKSSLILLMAGSGTRSGLDINKVLYQINQTPLFMYSLNKFHQVGFDEYILVVSKNDYDYITIDCPPSLGLITINSFTASDAVIIPIQCEFFALEGLSQLMNTIRLVKKKLNPEIAIDGVVLTMCSTSQRLM